MCRPVDLGELGGKSPDIVFADADLETAFPGAGMAVFANSGQICSAGTRLFVERKVYDEFVGRVADFGKGLRVGNGLDPDTQIGPLVSEQQLERVTSYLSVARQEGARAVAGGEQLTKGPSAKGFFVPPTVFADVRDDMRIAQEEIFGPVISAIPFDTKLSSPRTSPTPPPPPSIAMVPWLVIALFRSNVLGSVMLPTLRLADSILVVIFAPAMSVFITIGEVPLGSSLNEITAALAGPVPTKERVVIPSENIPSTAALESNLNFWVMCILH
jgi:hypothetical protein